MVLNIGNRICAPLNAVLFPTLPLAQHLRRESYYIEKCGILLYTYCGIHPIESEAAGRKAKGKINGGVASRRDRE